MQPLRFSEIDVDDRPRPGWYRATVATACWRQSAKNHRMVYVLLVVDAVAAPYDRISDYFVLEGVTPRGIACSRHRLVALFRAGGLLPEAGEEIRPERLEGLKVEIDLVHEVWNGKLRLQIRGYRPASARCEAPLDDIGAGPVAKLVPEEADGGQSK
jgi:hypothetical protein